MESAVPASAPVVPNASPHNKLNHSPGDKLAILQREYPDAIQFIHNFATDDDRLSCDACITDKAKRNPFVNITHNRYVPLEAVSPETTEPLAKEDLDGNKFLQLIYDAGSGYLSEVAMKKKEARPN